MPARKHLLCLLFLGSLALPSASASAASVMQQERAYEADPAISQAETLMKQAADALPFCGVHAYLLRSLDPHMESAAVIRVSKGLIALGAELSTEEKAAMAQNCDTHGGVLNTKPMLTMVNALVPIDDFDTVAKFQAVARQSLKQKGVSQQSRRDREKLITELAEADQLRDGVMQVAMVRAPDQDQAQRICFQCMKQLLGQVSDSLEEEEVMGPAQATMLAQQLSMYVSALLCVNSNQYPDCMPRLFTTAHEQDLERGGIKLSSPKAADFAAGLKKKGVGTIGGVIQGFGKCLPPLSAPGFVLKVGTMVRENWKNIADRAPAASVL